MQDSEARERIAALERLLEGVELLEDEGARRRSTELVQALLELYGEGLERIVAVVSEHERAGELAEALGRDELVSHLLLLHDLHPVPLEERVRLALQEVRPYLESHEGNVELLGIEEGRVRLRMEGSCNGCPSSTATLKLAIEEAIHKTAPEVEQIEAEGAVEEEEAPPLLRLELSDTLRAKRDDAWTAVADPALESGESVLLDVDGQEVLFLKLSRSMYAYRPPCPGCGESLVAAPLHDGCVACPACGARYDVRRAGRSLDSPDVNLKPVPLLHDSGGGMKVALG